MLKQITKYFLITLILSLGFGQLLRFELFGLPLYLHDVLVICFLVAQGLTCDWRTVLFPKGLTCDWRTVLFPKGLTFKEVPNPAYTIVGEGQTLKYFGLNLFLLGLAVGWVFTLFHYPLPPLLVPSLYTLRLLAYLALYLVLKHQKLKISPEIFLISGLVTLIIGLAQYIFMPDMRLFQYLGWDDHLSRLTLPHFDPTFTAIMLGLALFTFPKYSPLFMIGILLTYTRSIWISLALTETLFIKNKLVLLLTVGCMLLAIYLLPQKFGEGTNLLRTFSITSRFQADFSYVATYKWDLLVGRGMNTLILDAPSSLYPNHATGPNNSYLYLLLTSGILGLVGWGIFMHSLYLDSHFKPMLTFFLIASLFNNVMFYPFALLWVLLIHATQEKI